jgi:hypothetical protein
MSQPTQIFNGGESPLASKVTTASSLSHIGSTQSATQNDGGPAPDPASGHSIQLSEASTAPPYGGTVRARKS